MLLKLLAAEGICRECGYRGCEVYEALADDPRAGSYGLLAWCPSCGEMYNGGATSPADIKRMNQSLRLTH